MSNPTAETTAAAKPNEQTAGPGGEGDDVENSLCDKAEKEAKQNGRKLTLAARLDSVCYSDQEHHMIRQMQGRLMLSNQVVLTGGRGCGKTTAALMFARFLSAQEDHKVIWLDQDEVSSFHLSSSDLRPVIFIDDFMGKSSSESWNRWWSFQQFCSHIRHDTKTQAHIVLTTRTHLLDKLRSVTGAELNAVVPSSHVITMTLDHTKLWKEIKISVKMNERTNEHENALAQFMDNMKSPSIGFPLCCHLAPHVPTRLQGVLFRRPMSALRETVTKMMKTNTLAIPALAILAISESDIDTNVLLDSEDPQTRRYQQILDSLQEQKDSQNVRVREIVPFLQNCDGLVQIQDGFISFTNEAIREAVLIVLCDFHATFLVDHCSLKLILQIVEAPFEEPWLTYLSDHARKTFLDRILSELGAGNFHEVFSSDLFQNNSFMGMFADEMKEKDAVRNWVDTFDQNGLHFMFYACAVDRVWHCAKAFLNEKTDFWIILQAFLGCCYWGLDKDISDLLDFLKPCDKLRKSLRDATIEQIVTGNLLKQSQRDPPIWERSPIYPEDTPVAMAAWRGHRAVVETLGNKQFNLDKPGRHGCTAVMHGCARGNDELTQFLLKQKSSPTTVDDYKLTPIMHALMRGEWQIPDRLWTSKNCGGLGPNRKSTLMLACENGWNLKTMKKLVNLEVAPTLKDDEDRSCLHYACFNCRSHIVSYFLEKIRPDGNQRSTQGFTPLMFALAGSGDSGVVKVLLESKAANNAIDEEVIETACTYSDASVMGQLLPASRLVDKLDFFALGKACQKGNADIVRYLISQREVDPSKAVTRTGQTCLHTTSLGMPLEVVDMLLDAIDVDAVTESQETPLMLALRRGRVDFARHFRFRGAAIDARDASGNTCLHHAIQSGSVRALEWCIEEEHMDVNCKSHGGSTPLHLAVLRDDGRLVKYLLDQGAKVLAADNQGNTPFHLATAQRTGVSVLNMLSAKAGPEVWNVKNEIGSSPLDLARESGLLDKLRKECPGRESSLLD